MKIPAIKYLFINQIVADFRFWVALFFFLRLYGITLPPIETGHAWRQTFTCMVARNFLEQDPNIFLPRTDLSGLPGVMPGVVACEFPIFNYLIFLVAKIFGYQHWYGRLINLIVSSFGIYAFYLMARRYFGDRTALFSGMVFLSSSWFMFSRKIMPDTFSVSLVLIGLYYLMKYIETGKWNALLMFFFLGSLGGLSKIPATIILSLSLIAVFSRTVDISKRMLTLVGFLAAGMIIFTWYFMWEPILLTRYNNQLYFPRAFAQGINDLWIQWDLTLDKFTFASLRSYVALFFFILGTYQIIKTKESLLMLILGITFPVLIYFMIKSGYVFATHDYYILPFVPVMALIAGYGLASVKWHKLAWVFLVFILIEGIANQAHDFRLKRSELYLLDIETLADKVSSSSDYIAITGGLNPEEMYYAHRKGWGLGYEHLTDTAYLTKIRNQGCRFLFLNKKKAIPALDYPVVRDDIHYIIYRFD